MAIFQQRVGFTKDLWSSIDDIFGFGVLNNVSTSEISTLRFINATGITGFDHGYDGKEIEIINSTTSNLTLFHENTGSSASNRISCPDSTDVVLPPNAAIRLRYVSSPQRWHVSGGTGGGGGGGIRNYLEKWSKGLPIPISFTTIGEAGNVTNDNWHSTSVGGSFSLTIDTTTPLREKSSYESATNTSANTGGTVFFQTPRFQIDRADLGKALVVSFDSQYASGEWDVIVMRYDSSGVLQERIPLFGQASSSSLVPSAIIGTSVSLFRSYFVAGNNATDYYSVRFRRLSGSSQLKFDTLFCGPENSNAAIFADVPIGTVMPYAGTTLPSGWLFCDGASISTTDYPELFSVIGFSHGNPGGGLFRLPDYRGRFLRGVDGTAGIDPDKATRTAMNPGGNTGNNVGSVQGHAANVSLSGTTTFASSLHKHLSTTGEFSGTQYLNPVFGNAASPGGTVYTFSGLGGPFTSFGMNGHLTDTPDSTASVSLTGGGGNETRPVNAYVNYIIKARSNNGVVSFDVEKSESVFNTTTNVTSNTTSFGTGLGGGELPNGIAAGAFFKRVQFSTPILSSDKIVLELSFDAGQTWFEVLGGDNVLDLVSFQTQNTATYGIGLSPVSSTQLDVRFGQYQRPNGATFGSPGTNWAGSANRRYRVRKISNGAVSYPPINIKNIIDNRAAATTEAHKFSYDQITNTDNIANPNYGTTTNNVSVTLAKPANSGKILVTATLTYRYQNTNGTNMQTGIRIDVIEGSSTLYSTPSDTIVVPIGFDGYLTRSINVILESTNSTAYTIRASEYNAGMGSYSANSATLSTSASLVRV